MTTTAPNTDQTDKLALIEQAMQARFSSGYPRSAAYKNGTRSIFQQRIIGGRIGPLPYPAGSAKADAYFAGQQDGRALFAAYLAESAQTAKAAQGEPA